MTVHLCHQGRQLGEFSKEQVEAMLKAGVITDSTLAWTSGLAEWKALREVLGATTPPAVPPPQTSAAITSGSSPGHFGLTGNTPKTVNVPPVLRTPVTKQIHPVAAYFVPVGRIGRGKWFLFNLMNLFGIGLLAAPFVDSQSDGASAWMTFLGCLWIYLTIVNAGKRLHDLNISAWLSFVVIIPLVPLFLLILSGTKGPNQYSSLSTQDKTPNTPGHPVTAASGGHSSLRPIVLVMIAVLFVVAGGVWLWLAEKPADIVSRKGETESMHQLYDQAANQNNIVAQNNLGVRYDSGQGVVKDQVEAAKWFRKAAERNYAVAEYNLGFYYANGTGVAKDEVEAVKWYRKAAEQGYAPAQNNLGGCYGAGAKVLLEDDVAAVKWYQKAAEQGYDPAQANLRRLLRPRPRRGAG